MRISAKADYAVRALVELAAGDEGTPVKGEAVARAEHVTLADVVADELPPEVVSILGCSEPGIDAADLS